MADDWYRWEGDDLLLRLRVQPKASRDAFVGPYGDDAYKVSTTAPPVDGKANAHLTKWLAKAFGVPQRRVVLTGGETGRNKQFRIQSPSKLPLALPKPGKT